MNAEFVVQRSTLNGSLLSPPESPKMSEFPAHPEEPTNPLTLSSPVRNRRMDNDAIVGVRQGVPQRPLSNDQAHWRMRISQSQPVHVPHTLSGHQSTSLESRNDLNYSSNGLPNLSPRREPARYVNYPSFAPPQAASGQSDAAISSHEGPAVAVEDDQMEEDDGFISSASVGDDNTGMEGTAKTAAERRADKRKMKRFRLTHSQTRFLMSEFARQAHPDAAQRERLSREIPGLSSRQVQVWFQNRRAKLKRLTTDDQERMLKSRALPEGFDTTHTLHSPYQGYQNPFEMPTSSLHPSAPGRANDTIRPVIVDSLSQAGQENATTSPISMASGFGDFYTTPNSISTVGNLSPISPASDRSHLFSPPASQGTSPRNVNPFGRSSSFPTISSAYSYIPRVHLPERMPRPRTGSLASPLRSEMSHTAEPIQHELSQPITVTPLGSAPRAVHHRPMQDSSRTIQAYAGFGNEAMADLTPVKPDETTLYSWPSSQGLGIAVPMSHTQFRTNLTGFERPRYGSLTELSQIYDGRVDSSLRAPIQSAPLVAPHDFQLPQQQPNTYSNLSYPQPYERLDQFSHAGHQPFPSAHGISNQTGNSHSVRTQERQPFALHCLPQQEAPKNPVQPRQQTSSLSLQSQEQPGSQPRSEETINREENDLTPKPDEGTKN